MKNLLVAQSGGPTSAINATLAGVVENALSSPSVDRIYGSINGIQGVLTENLIDLKCIRTGSSLSDPCFCTRLLPCEIKRSCCVCR